jgi:hypothetical protein
MGSLHCVVNCRFTFSILGAAESLGNCLGFGELPSDAPEELAKRVFGVMQRRYSSQARSEGRETS